MKRPLAIAAFAALIAAGVAVTTLLNHGHESTDDAMIEAAVTPVAAKVPGYVAAVHARDNQMVKKGDALLDIDPRDYALHLDAARAALAAAEIEAANADTNARRQKTIGKVAGTQRDIDNAAAAAASARAAVDRAAAEVKLAEQQLADTHVIAAEDGTVTLKTVEPGAYVTPGQRLMSLVGTDRWVVANFKEVQITDMRPGQRVEIAVDAYPALKLAGRVDSIQSGTGSRFSAFPAENATGNFVKIVQRVPVKILIDGAIPAGITLGPGLSVVPTVYTGKPAVK